MRVRVRVRARVSVRVRVRVRVRATGLALGSQGLDVRGWLGSDPHQTSSAPSPIAARPASTCSLPRSCDPPISAQKAAACWLRPSATVAAHSPSLPQSRGSDSGTEHASRVDELLVDVERVVEGSAPAGGHDLRRTLATNDPTSAIRLNTHSFERSFESVSLEKPAAAHFTHGVIKPARSANS